MRLTLTMLGHTLDVNLTAETQPEPQSDGPGEATSYPIGFTPGPGDQRWQPGADLE